MPFLKNACAASCSAGMLNKRVILQQPQEQRSLSGQSTDTWADAFEVWAAVEPLQGKDLWQAQSITPLATAKITIRYRTNFDGNWRVKYQGRVFNIIGHPIDPNEEHVFLVLNCIEGKRP